jgi:hypothetical protein
MPILKCMSQADNTELHPSIKDITATQDCDVTRHHGECDADSKMSQIV